MKHKIENNEVNELDRTSFYYKTTMNIRPLYFRCDHIQGCVNDPLPIDNTTETEVASK